MKPEISLPHSKKPARQTNPVRAPPFNFLTVHFNIILLLTSRSSKWFHTLRFPHQNTVAPLLSIRAKPLSFLRWSAENMSHSNKPLVFRPTQPCVSIHEQLHVLVLTDHHRAINTTFKKRKVKCNTNDFTICIFLLCGIPQIHNCGQSVANSSETFPMS